MVRKLIVISLVVVSLTACCPAKKSVVFRYDAQEEWHFQSGQSQSPVDIATSTVETMKEPGILSANYAGRETKITDKGHTIQVNARGTLYVNGRSFALTQFHFHAPSEHTIDSKHAPMEVHFVHTAQNGRIAVVGVFLTLGKKNATFQTILDCVAEDRKGDASHPLKSAELLPENKSYYHYLGSLTTPPLTENVEWYILKEPVSISKSQIGDFSQYYDQNNRNTQPLNDRPLLEHNQLSP